MGKIRHLPQPARRQAMAAVQRRAGALGAEIAEVFGTPRRKVGREVRRRRVIDVVAERVRHDRLEAVAKAAGQLRSEPVIGGIGPRHEADDAGQVKAGIGVRGHVAGAGIELPQRSGQTVEGRLRGRREIRRQKVLRIDLVLPVEPVLRQQVHAPRA